jgi:hypothetical protein
MYDKIPVGENVVRLDVTGRGIGGGEAGNETTSGLGLGNWSCTLELVKKCCSRMSDRCT